jgi:hypothetical protein
MRTETNGHSHDGIDASLGYEARDVSLRTLVKWIVGLYIFIFLTVLGTIPLYFLLVPRAESAAATTRQPTTKRRLPEPVIQSHPIQDMREFLLEQEHTATTYGRIEGEPGKVHIPVDRAIDKVLSAGLTSKEASAPPAPAGIYTAVDTTAASAITERDNPLQLPKQEAAPAGPPGPAPSH